MSEYSRRRFLQLAGASGCALVSGEWIRQVLQFSGQTALAAAAEPIKIGILDPLSTSYKTSSIPFVHGANVADDLYNKRGGVLGRQVVILEADDASNPDTAVKAATKFIKEERVDFLMGTFNADCALAVSELAQKEHKLFMVTGAHLPELTGSACNSHTFVFMPNATMMAQAVVPHLVKAYGTRWYMLTTGTLDGKAMAQAIVASMAGEFPPVRCAYRSSLIASSYRPAARSSRIVLSFAIAGGGAAVASPAVSTRPAVAGNARARRRCPSARRP